MVVWIHNIWSFPTKRKNNFFWRRTILRREILSIKMSTPKSNVFSRRKISRLKILSIKYSNCLPQNCPSPPKKCPSQKLTPWLEGEQKTTKTVVFSLFLPLLSFSISTKKGKQQFSPGCCCWEDVSLKTFDRTIFFFWVFTHAFFNFSYWRLTLFNFYFYFHKMWIILTEPNACLMDIFSLHKKLKWSKLINLSSCSWFQLMNVAVTGLCTQRRIYFIYERWWKPWEYMQTIVATCEKPVVETGKFSENSKKIFRQNKLVSKLRVFVFKASRKFKQDRLCVHQPVINHQN